MQTEQLLCKSGMTYAEHSTISRSNEEDDRKAGPRPVKPFVF